MGERRKHPIDAHVGSRLRFRRMSLGMSQETLGAALGVSFQQIQKYEQGSNRLAASTLYMASKVLRVSIDYFYTGMDGAESAAAAVETMQAVHKHEGSAFNRSFAAIKDPALTEALLSVMKELAGPAKDEKPTARRQVNAVKRKRRASG